MFYLFYACAALVLAGAWVVCFSRELPRSLMGLLAVVVGIAGLFLVLQAKFLAAVQLSVWGGGVVMMLMVGIEMTRKAGRSAPPRQADVIRALIVGGLVAAALLAVVALGPWHIWVQSPEATATTEDLGRSMISIRGYLVPLEIMGVLLLSVLVGAAYLARIRRAPDLPPPVKKKVQTAPSRERSGIGGPA